MAASSTRRLATVLAVATLAAVTAGLLGRLAVERAATATRRTPVSSASSTPHAFVLSPAWKVLMEDAQGGISLLQTDGSPAKHILNEATQPVWSPDHRRFAFARAGNVWVTNANGTSSVQVTHWAAEKQGNFLRGIAWDPVEDTLVVARAETFQLSRANGTTKQTLVGTSLYRVAPHAGARPQLWYDLGNGGTGAHYSDYEHPAWSPSGKYLALAINGDIWIATRGDLREDEHGKPQPGVYTWDLTRVTAPARFDAPDYRGSRENYAVTALSWAPDETRLAYGIERLNGSGFAEVHVLTLNLTGTEEDWRPTATSDTRLPLYAFRPSFSPDGNWLLLTGRAGEASGPLRLLAVTPDGTAQSVLADGGSASAVW